ncbi:hypothetical protein CC78DRAFT_529100 [Lojkania enalia]|uniref:Uncharacterized protein n=1 Tax=Lojkania enalia TaxID=147567 RepID=A0A9P4NB23_9PLEO|nr:hypothetical protein CC78DRAFT_529100 [Didymosphaeria enalia]
MSSMPHNVDNAGQGGVPNPHHETEKTGVVGNMSQSTKGADINPSESSNPGLDPSSGIAPSQKQQGADRPKDAPTGDEAAAVKGKKDEAEEALAKRDPNDHSGEPMHMHDGSVPATQAERRVSKVGNPGGQEHGKEEKGTGEKWVKSTGLASEGGDFDVTKPGAGREADRLLEERGIKETSSGEHSQSDTNEPQETGHQEKQKVPLREKVKSKLHIGHK